MGGSAFSSTLPATAFPRIPPAVYKALKARIVPKLAGLYAWVGVPVEAPEKLDHGDLDLIVANSKQAHTALFSHQLVKDAIGATYIVPMDGNRTSNYAVPISQGEWSAFGHADDEDCRRSASEGGQIYYQVDIHVCEDKAEWDRIFFFHSYGDMGMILGLIARNNGLALGAKGLKLPDAPNQAFELSENFDEIAKFLELSLPAFYEGFSTKVELFKWAATCKGFDPTHFRSVGPGITKVKVERTMYAEFVEWVEEARNQAKRSEMAINAAHTPSREDRQAKVREEALVFFNRKEAFEALAKSRYNRQRLKDCFSGSRVRDWAELGEYWKGVKLVMDEVRVRLGGDNGVLAFLDEHSEEELRMEVIQARVDLGLLPNIESLATQERGQALQATHPSALSASVKGVSLTQERSKKASSDAL